MRRVTRVAALVLAVGAGAFMMSPVRAASPSAADLATRAALLRLTVNADTHAGAIDSRGVSEALTAMLSRVTSSAEGSSAANTLDAFTNTVAAQRGKHITAAAADGLTRIANGIMPTAQTVTPGAAGVVATDANTTPVAVEVPAGTSVAQVTVTPAATATPVQPPASYKPAAAVVVTATTSSDERVTSFQSSPLTISVGFRPLPGTLATKAELDTIDPSSQDTQRLATTITANSDGSYTATALTTHLTPFVVNAPEAPGVITTILGGPETGQATSVGQAPTGVAVTRAGAVVVADAVNSVIRVVDPSSGYESVLAGTGVAGNFGDGGPAAAAQFNNPYGVAVDDVTGTMYVADYSNQEIRAIAPDGSTINNLSYADGPMAVSAHNGIVYVAGGGRTDVTGLAPDGTATSILSDGRVGTGIARDTAGNLFVSESDPITGGGELVEIRSDGSTLTLLNTAAPSGGDASGQASDQNPVGPLNGVAVDDAGNIYFSEPTYSRVFEVTRVAPSSSDTEFGAPIVVAGTGAAGYNDDPTVATNAALNGPGPLAYAAGVLYVADSNNDRVRAVNLTNGGTMTIAGRDGATEDLGRAPNVPLVKPAAVAFDAIHNRTYVADDFEQSPSIYQVDAAGTVSQLHLNGIYGNVDEIIWVSNGRKPPAVLQSRIVDLVVDSQGRLLIGDAGRGLILRYDPAACDATTATCSMTTLAGPGETVQTAQQNTAGGPGSNVYQHLRAITTDTHNNVWVADQGFDPASSNVYMISPTNILGVAAKGLNDPISVTSDGAGGAYVALAGTNSVTHLTSTQATIVAGAPSGVVRTDPQGRLLVNTGTTIMRVDNGTATAVAGNGTVGFSGDGGPATSASFNQPAGMATDDAGDLLIADVSNGRVRMVVAGY